MVANALVSFPVPQFVLQAPRFFADEGFHDSMISNNPLAVELETENDAACEIFLLGLFVIHFGFEAAPRRDNDKDYFK